MRVDIGNDVWIGGNAYIMSGVRVGDGAIIAAGSLVTRDVEPYSVVAGVPSRVLSFRFNERIVECLEKVEWWTILPEQLENLNIADIGGFINKCFELKSTSQYFFPASYKRFGDIENNP